MKRNAPPAEIVPTYSFVKGKGWIPSTNDNYVTYNGKTYVIECRKPSVGEYWLNVPKYEYGGSVWCYAKDGRPKMKYWKNHTRDLDLVPFSRDDETYYRIRDRYWWFTLVPVC